MKSSYELAMERMGGEDKPLTSEQKGKNRGSRCQVQGEDCGKKDLS